MRREDVLTVARVLRKLSAAESEEALKAMSPDVPGLAEGSEAARYLAVIRALPDQPDVPEALRGLAFRPFFLLNGLILAARYYHPVQMFVLEVLATGLEAFPDYFAHIVERRGGDASALKALERRVFAFYVAQLSEVGMALDEIFLTMKGDSLGRESSAELRQILEQGPPALDDATLFTDAEKALLRAVVEGDPGAWPALQAHLIETYALPFVRSPSPQS